MPRYLGHIRQLIGIVLAEHVVPQVDRDFEFLKRNCLYRRFQCTTQQLGGPPPYYLAEYIEALPLEYTH